MSRKRIVDCRNPFGIRRIEHCGDYRECRACKENRSRSTCHYNPDACNQCNHRCPICMGDCSKCHLACNNRREIYQIF